VDNAARWRARCLAGQAIDLPRDWIHVGDPEDIKFVRSLFADRRWDAVVCANDMTAAQLMRGSEKNGIGVPRDLRLVCFDDVHYATPLSVPLTTIHPPAREIPSMPDRIFEQTLPVRTI